MKKFKRVLSLILVICTIIPLIITTEITSSAVEVSTGWYKTETDYKFYNNTQIATTWATSVIPDYNYIEASHGGMSASSGGAIIIYGTNQSTSNFRMEVDFSKSNPGCGWEDSYRDSIVIGYGSNIASYSLETTITGDKYHFTSASSSGTYLEFSEYSRNSTGYDWHIVHNGVAGSDHSEESGSYKNIVSVEFKKISTSGSTSTFRVYINDSATSETFTGDTYGTSIPFAGMFSCYDSGTQDANRIFQIKTVNGTAAALINEGHEHSYQTVYSYDSDPSTATSTSTADFIKGVSICRWKKCSCGAIDGNVTYTKGTGSDTTDSNTLNIAYGAGLFGNNTTLTRKYLKASDVSVSIVPGINDSTHDARGGSKTYNSSSSDRTWIYTNFGGIAPADVYDAQLNYTYYNSKAWFRGWNTKTDGTGTWVNKIDSSTITALKGTDAYDSNTNTVTLSPVWGFPMTWNINTNNIASGTKFSGAVTAKTATVWSYAGYSDENGNYPHPARNGSTYYYYNNADPYGFPKLTTDSGISSNDVLIPDSVTNGDKVYTLLKRYNGQLQFWLVGSSGNIITDERTDTYVTRLGAEHYNTFAADANGLVQCYAIWLPNIVYKSNGGTGTMTNSVPTVFNPDTRRSYGNGTINTSNNTFTPMYQSSLELSKNTYTAPDNHTFYKWNTKADGSGTAYSDKQSIDINNTGAMTLYAQWGDKMTYTNLNGATLSGTNNTVVENNKSYTVLSISNPPTGFTFKGWDTDNDGVKDFEQNQTITPTSNMTFAALWEEAYTVSYDGLTGATPSSIVTATKNKDEVLTISNTKPTKTGYTFLYWQDTFGNTYQPSDAYVFNKSTTLTAQWSADPTPPTTTNITYNGNGGYFNASSTKTTITDTKTSGQTYNIAGAIPYRGNTYKFIGWTTSSDGSGTVYHAGTEYTGNETTFYAKWSSISKATNRTLSAGMKTANTGTITWSGGSTSSTSADVTIFPQNTYTADDYVHINAKPARGYYISAAAFSQNVYYDGQGNYKKTFDVTDINNLDINIYGINCTISVSKLTVTATAHKYYVQFCYRNGTAITGGKTSQRTYGGTSGGVTTAVFSAPSEGGGTFIGWALTRNATTPLIPASQFNGTPVTNGTTFRDNIEKYLPDSVFENLSTAETDTVKLYAVYAPNYVHYNANDGENAPNPTLKYYGQTVKISDFTGVTRGSDEVCIGWSTDKNATTPDPTYDYNSDYSTNANLTLYAVWQKSHTITFKPGYYSTSGKETSVKVADGNQITLSSQSFSRNNCTLKGWATSDGAQSTTYSIDDRITPTGNMTLYPVYYATIGVNVTPDSNAGKVTGGGSYAVGKEITLEADANPGYSFDGWYVNGNKQTTSEPGKYTFTVSENTLVTANFTATSSTFNLHVFANVPAAASYTLTTHGQHSDQGEYPYSAKDNVTITFDSTDTYEFKYWTNATGKIVSQEPTYTFVMVGDTTLTAIFTDKQSSVKSSMVVYETSYGQVIKSQYYTTSDSITPPNEPLKVGYECLGWNMQPEAIKTAIAEGNKMIVVKPMYKEDNMNYSVTIDFLNSSDETIADQKYGTYRVGATFKYTAPDQINGLYFNCWKDGEGNIISYSNTYIAYPSTERSIVLKAYYASEQGSKNPIIRLTDFGYTYDATKGIKFTFEATRSLPEGYIIVEQGFMVYKGTSADVDKYAADGEIPYDLQLTDSKADKKVGNINEEGVTIYALNVGNASITAGKIYYVQGYMWVQYTNSEGKLVQERKYSEVKCVKANDSQYAK